ncbi:MAG: nitrilase-related carbon-nitrogen hydrolase [Enterocloster sp.]
MQQKIPSIWLAGSMPEKDDEEHVYNTCYVFDREGKQIGKHRKARSV